MLEGDYIVRAVAPATGLVASPTLINEMGDCPNIDFPTMGGKYFWSTVDERDGLRLQFHKAKTSARILDSSDIRVAWGSITAMMEKFQRLTRDEFLEPGDVIGIERSDALNIYEHYAVYIGSGRVIHYAGTGKDFGGEISVHEAPISEFLGNDTNYFVLYFSNKTSAPFKIYSENVPITYNSVTDEAIKLFHMKRYNIYTPEQTIKRARERIGEQRYNLVLNNCEHFAIWCKTGVSESIQINKVKNILINRILDI